MSNDQTIAGYDVASGALRGSRLSLYANRLVLHGGDATETIPLAHLASVRVAFERDARKFNWAVVLLIVALVLALVSGPLQSAIGALAAGVKEQAGRESLDAVLLAAFSGLGVFARLLFPMAGLLAAIAVALLVFFWLGCTTLTLSFAAAERAVPVLGRNDFLVQFAEAVADQLAARKD